MDLYPTAGMHLLDEETGEYNIPFIKISFFGVDDTIMSLRLIAKKVYEINGNTEIIDEVMELFRRLR